MPKAAESQSVESKPRTVRSVFFAARAVSLPTSLNAFDTAFLMLPQPMNGILSERPLASPLLPLSPQLAKSHISH